MKPRSLASLLALAAALFFTGCPTNTYPAGEKDAYPLTDYEFFKREEHEKMEAHRKVLADLKATPEQRAEAQKNLADPDKLRKEREETESLDKARPKMRAVLARLFGSPEHPAKPPTGTNTIPDIGPVFDNPSFSDAEELGSPLDTGRKLYKLHCIHCHGFYGNGDGPTANFLLPKPRDFRYGKVKFTSTKGGVPPTHEDVVRTIAQGLQGTMMPAFGPPEGMPNIGIFAGHAGPPGFDVDAVAQYVDVLLMRGAVEQQLAAKWSEESDLTKGSAQEAVNQKFAEWQTAADQVVKPETKRPADFAASAKRGAVLYGLPGPNDENKKLEGFGKAGCVKCHGLRGLGADSSPEDGALDLNALNDFKLPALPMNLTHGLYRGGRRPLDLYRRMYAGIKGTPMPGQAGNLTSDEIWNVVDYVYELGMPKAEK